MPWNARTSTPSTSGCCGPQEIVLVLRGSLKPEIWSGGPALMSIYAYVYKLLVRGNVHKDAGALSDARKILGAAPGRMACRRRPGPGRAGRRAYGAQQRRARRVTDGTRARVQARGRRAGPRGGSPPGPAGKTGGRSGAGAGAGTAQHARPRQTSSLCWPRRRASLTYCSCRPGAARAWSPLSTNCRRLSRT